MYEDVHAMRSRLIRCLAIPFLLLLMVSTDLHAATSVSLPTSPRAERAQQEAQRRLQPALQALGLRAGSPVYLRVFKQESILELWMARGEEYVLFKRYPICRWSGALGPKQREGDGQAPEGGYALRAGSLNPNSAYHLAMNLGFPNRLDRALGRTGSFLMIHGRCVSIGCYAMGDEAIEEIYTLVAMALAAGVREVPVHAFPFVPSRVAMRRHARSPWIEGWRDLASIYTEFERHRQPPVVRIEGNRYRLRTLE